MTERFADSNDPIPQALIEAICGQCWSLWEGCVCAYHKEHSGPHVCADQNCCTSWTTQQSVMWMEAEREAHRTNTTIKDRHRKESGQWPFKA